jgi:D-alanine-D-alanine ligase
MGGFNSEREISLKSGEAVYNALLEMGYNAIKIDFSFNIVADLLAVKPDIVFNALHGSYGEDGKIQGLLDILKIPYTHSNLLTSALCMNKSITHQICQTANINTARHCILRQGDNIANQQKISSFATGFVLKPIGEGSSIGVEVIKNPHNYDFSLYQWQHGNEILIEQYIAGQELDVAVINGKALGVIEVRPSGDFYDYKCKYTPGLTQYIMPAPIDVNKYNEALQIAEKAATVFGCSDFCRIEFILNNKNNGDNKLYLLEINTHPGFTATSLVPK